MPVSLGLSAMRRVRNLVIVRCVFYMRMIEIVPGVIVVMVVIGFVLVNMDVRTIIARMLMPDRDAATRRLTRIYEQQVRRTWSTKYSCPSSPGFADYFHGSVEAA